MRLLTAAVTDVGRVRSENQDAVLATDRLGVVADGMGGHRGGEVASSVTITVFDANPQVSTIDGLIELARTANREVLHRSLTEPLLAGMGTTLCAVAALRSDPPTVGIINIGDSRVYLLDGRRMIQLSEDHSFVETLVREGRLTPAQAEVHPQRNVLTRALGIEPEVSVDAWEVECGDGDRLLLCSDGLFNEVTDEDIEAVLRRDADPTVAATALMQMAVEAGGHDNVSCVIADVIDAPWPTATTGAAGEPVERSVVRVAGQSTVPLSLSDSDQADGPVPTGGDRADPERPLLTWRVGLLALAILAIFAGAAGAAAWWGTRGYELKAVGAEVKEFRGHDLPWQTRSSSPTGIRIDRIEASAKLTEVCDGIAFDNRNQLAAYVADLEASLGSPVAGRDCRSVLTPLVVGSTTAKPSTTTTGPAASDTTSTAAVETTTSSSTPP